MLRALPLLSLSLGLAACGQPSDAKTSPAPPKPGSSWSAPADNHLHLTVSEVPWTCEGTVQGRAGAWASTNLNLQISGYGPPQRPDPDTLPSDPLFTLAVHMRTRRAGQYQLVDSYPAVGVGRGLLAFVKILPQAQFSILQSEEGRIVFTLLETTGDSLQDLELVRVRGFLEGTFVDDQGRRVPVSSSFHFER